jgi:hypothetical protein
VITYFSLGAARSTSGTLNTDERFTGQRLFVIGTYKADPNYLQIYEALRAKGLDVACYNPVAWSEADNLAALDAAYARGSNFLLSTPYPVEGSTYLMEVKYLLLQKGMVFGPDLTLLVRP